MEFKDLIAAIRDVGFPIGITIYLLVRFDKLMVTILQTTAKELQVLTEIHSYLMFRGLPDANRRPGHGDERI